MKIFHAAIAAICISAAFGAHAREGAYVVNHDNVAIPARNGVALSEEAVRTAVLTALRTKEWTVVAPATPGVVTASLVVRNKHTITVDIPYAANAYSIRYRDSVNMNYQADGFVRPAQVTITTPPTPRSGPIIHPNYNVWVSQLMTTINAELARL